MEYTIQLIDEYYKRLKDISSSEFIERKIRSGYLRGCVDYDRCLLEEINKEYEKLYKELHETFLINK